MLALNTSLDSSKAHLNHSKGEVIRFLVLVYLWRKRLAFLSSEFSLGDESEVWTGRVLLSQPHLSA